MSSVKIYSSNFETIFPSTSMTFSLVRTKAERAGVKGLKVTAHSVGGKGFGQVSVFSAQDVLLVCDDTLKRFKTLENGKLYTQRWEDFKKFVVALIEKEEKLS